MEARAGMEETQKLYEEELTEVHNRLAVANRTRAELEESGRTLEESNGELRRKLQVEARGRAEGEQINRRLGTELQEALANLSADEKTKQVLQDTLQQRDDELRLLRGRVEREGQAKTTAESARAAAEEELTKLRSKYSSEVKARTALEESIKLLEGEVDDLRRRVRARGAASASLLSPEAAKLVNAGGDSGTASGVGAYGGAPPAGSRNRSPLDMRKARLENELRDLHSRVGEPSPEYSCMPPGTVGSHADPGLIRPSPRLPDPLAQMHTAARNPRRHLPLGPTANPFTAPRGSAQRSPAAASGPRHMATMANLRGTTSWPIAEGGRPWLTPAERPVAQADDHVWAGEHAEDARVQARGAEEEAGRRVLSLRQSNEGPVHAGVAASRLRVVLGVRSEPHQRCCPECPWSRTSGPLEHQNVATALPSLPGGRPGGAWTRSRDHQLCGVQV